MDYELELWHPVENFRYLTSLLFIAILVDLGWPKAKTLKPVVDRSVKTYLEEPRPPHREL